MDTRPANCRFSLQDEGKSHPRSACAACGKTITTGLGRCCTVTVSPNMVSGGIEQQTRSESDMFWAAVFDTYGTDDPITQRRLSEAIGKFRQAQADLTEALARK